MYVSTSKASFSYHTAQKFDWIKFDYNPRMKFDEQNFDEFTVVFIGKAFREKVRAANFDKLLAICQICKNFPSKFCTIWYSFSSPIDLATWE